MNDQSVPVLILPGIMYECLVTLKHHLAPLSFLTVSYAMRVAALDFHEGISCAWCFLLYACSGLIVLAYVFKLDVLTVFRNLSMPIKNN